MAEILQNAVLAFFFFLILSQCHSTSRPLNCSETARICTSFLAFKAAPNVTISLVQSMFDVFPEDVTADKSSSPDYLFIRKNCSCLYNKKYLANTTFTMRGREGLVNETVASAYDGLALLPNSTRRARVGAVISLHLICGCSSGLWNYLMSYVMEEGDSVQSLSSRFGVSMDDIETVNGMDGPNGGFVGDVYYIPLNSVPGQPYLGDDISPTTQPAPAPTSSTVSEYQDEHSTKFPYLWVIGSVGVTVFMIGTAVLLCVSFRSCNFRSPYSHRKCPEQPIPHKFQILNSSSFCYASRRFLCFKSENFKHSTQDSGDHLVNIPNGITADAFDIEKPIIFTFEGILLGTDSFSDTNLLGHGTYGSVYYGFLRDQEVAIKRMTATKIKEFIAEMKVLCNVHHSSLVELIGYAVSTDELFLVYEYAQKGSLKNHLHDSQYKDHTSLSWITRVQIALDAAKGLEYIHEHTKNHYVHRDIKSSNILLDSDFRAKISDFGLAKLLAPTNDGEASTTKVVGTFGYLAPEYLRNGLATSKSDVYAFGVVLFELISGRETISKTEETLTGKFQRRSLASIMLAALKKAPNSTSMASLKEYIDPSLKDLYPHDCVYKMALLAKECVDEDPILRPDMKQVVISISHILLSSVEWEATLAGNSQVFSGLVQGR
ncbi:lysM domain receptor-like kinase 3 isoform X1 [Phalaenopsis equestris]|uniref:lysM domain receptor-like kinase 3 isoform X1 n=1 Tax=Phalaenopsis equestris TaxID=78828 RepID=UPI0009E65CF0|nr:lysM domain receptor-like kinase 3 isoform X1 [Phalaenopsis equestris]